MNLNALRVFRVLRPLRTISSIKSLKVLLITLFSSLPMLLDSILILAFFFLIFAIAGLQLFSGFLKKRCFQEISGIIFLESDNKLKYCGYVNCPNNYLCGKLIANPNYGVTNFDNILYSFLMVFQSVTLEGWSSIMFGLIKTFSIFSVVYFVPLVFVGSFFLLNLTLAVIKAKFTDTQGEKKESNTIEIKEKEDECNFNDLKNFKKLEREHIKRYSKKLKKRIVNSLDNKIDNRKTTLFNRLSLKNIDELKERIKLELIKEKEQENDESNTDENSTTDYRKNNIKKKIKIGNNKISQNNIIKKPRNLKKVIINDSEKSIFLVDLMGKAKINNYNKKEIQNFFPKIEESNYSISEEIKSKSFEINSKKNLYNNGSSLDLKDAKSFVENINFDTNEEIFLRKKKSFNIIRVGIIEDEEEKVINDLKEKNTIKSLINLKTIDSIKSSPKLNIEKKTSNEIISNFSFPSFKNKEETLNKIEDNLMADSDFFSSSEFKFQKKKSKKKKEKKEVESNNYKGEVIGNENKRESTINNLEIKEKVELNILLESKKNSINEQNNVKLKKYDRLNSLGSLVKKLVNKKLGKNREAGLEIKKIKNIRNFKFMVDHSREILNYSSKDVLLNINAKSKKNKNNFIEIKKVLFRKKKIDSAKKDINNYLNPNKSKYLAIDRNRTIVMNKKLVKKVEFEKDIYENENEIKMFFFERSNTLVRKKKNKKIKKGKEEDNIEGLSSYLQIKKFIYENNLIDETKEENFPDFIQEIEEIHVIILE